MTMKKPSEISELIYEAQDPIDETSDLDETDSNNFLVFLLTRDYQEEMLYTDRKLYMAIAKDFVKDLPYSVIGAACFLSTFIATDCLLLGSDNLNLNNKNYSVQKEKAAICDKVIAPLQKMRRGSKHGCSSR